MRVIPVIDLLGGQVVRAIGGRRHEYRPIESSLCRDAQPANIARTFVENFGFDTVYVADLDAITGREPDLTSYKSIADCGLRLWIDAGVQDLNRTYERVIIGLESIDDPDEIAPLVETIDADRCIFSLDLRDGRPLTSAWKNYRPDQIAKVAFDAGVRAFIVLDLAQVGGFGGAQTESLCRRLRDAMPHIELFAGGGVRDVNDLLALANAGCDGAIVASALHDGRITVEDLMTLERLFSRDA
jgi:phosphoribosylformimino-5-aminoimidazole carboxamide ribotide isomerase